MLSGEVVHKRVFPIRHKLKYGTFSILLDLDNTAGVCENCRLFSYNSWNVLSFFDKDHADGTQENLAQYARTLVSEELDIQQIGKVFLMTYPRVFGYVFNPLSVYFCHAPDSECVALIFEVSNTFGGRKTYVQRIEGTRIEHARKQLVVSPFNGNAGEYTFRADQSGEFLTIGVTLRERETPVLNTWYKVKCVGFTDWHILRLSISRPLMTMKVIAAIHFEALKLWLKGLRFPNTKPVA